MAYYAKKVVYLSEMEYGNKIKGAGFVRMEFSGEACSLDMHISGMTSLPQKKYDISVVLLSGKKYDIGDIYIHNGSGEWKAQYENGYFRWKRPDETFIGDEALLCTEIAELQIQISDTKVISGKTGLEGNTVKAAQIPEEKKYWSERPGRKWEFLRSGLMDKRLNNLDILEEPEKENADEPMEIESMKEDGLMQKVTQDDEGWKGFKSVEEVNHIDKNKMEAENQMDVIILNDKWDQLQQIYPVVHPYEDEREYISIEPKDFVIMTGDYQHLANNSFLLHGFYNYRHIVLGRERDGFFYLGVPGVYYEREKMVALMFGFEAFECNGEKAEAGKFGYYLRKVRI